MKKFSRKDLDALTLQARENPRLRKNLNIHPDDGSLCQRLFNAIEPDSYIPAHRHLDPEKDETFLLVRGKLGVILFADSGEVVETILLATDGEFLAADIPYGIYHTAVSLAGGTIFFEAKGGPYLPLREEEQATWAPAAGTPAAAVCLARLKELFLSP